MTKKVQPRAPRDKEIRNSIVSSCLSAPFLALLATMARVTRSALAASQNHAEPAQQTTDELLISSESNSIAPEFSAQSVAPSPATPSRSDSSITPTLPLQNRNDRTGNSHRELSHSAHSLATSRRRKGGRNDLVDRGGNNNPVTPLQSRLSHPRRTLPRATSLSPRRTGQFTRSRK